MSLSFRRTLTVTASTSRTVLSGTGQSSGPTVILSNIAVSEPTPVTADIRGRLVLDTPHEVLMTFCDDALDVQNGDTLTLSDSVNVVNKDYQVRAVERWPWTNGTTFKALIIEDLKV